jgi:hypothetical protein
MSDGKELIQSQGQESKHLTAEGTNSMMPPPLQLRSSPANPNPGEQPHYQTESLNEESSSQANSFSSNSTEGNKTICLQCQGRDSDKSAQVGSNVIQRQGICHGTNRIGNLKRRGVVEHILIQQHYLSTNPFAEVEYAIPGSSANGNTGYADIVNTISNEIFEVKHISVSSTAIPEVARYVTMAKIHCDPGANWIPGVSFAPVVLPYTNPNEELVARLKAPGVIEYWTRKKQKKQNPQPVPVPVPEEKPSPKSVVDQILELARSIYEGGLDAAKATEEWLQENPGMAGAIAGIGIVAILALLADDLSGVGILDDFLIPIVWTIMRTAMRAAF